MASTFRHAFRDWLYVCRRYANAKAAGMDMSYGAGHFRMSSLFGHQSYMSNYVFQNAFGCVSMIAMMPLIVIQLMGLYAEIKRAIHSQESSREVHRTGRSSSHPFCGGEQMKFFRRKPLVKPLEPLLEPRKETAPATEKKAYDETHALSGSTF
jgi:hypothetical protein